MATHNSDPIDWGVDEVVAFLCNPESAPWAQSATSARPDPVTLEAALRENIIGGEALLNDVDSNALKNDLGLKALGHRSSLMRAIEWLRLQSPKYLISKKSRSLDELTTTGTPNNENTSSLRSTPVPAPFSSVALVSSRPTDPVVPQPSSDKTRRIVPTLVTGPEANELRQEAARLAGDHAQNVTPGTSLLGRTAPTADTGGFHYASTEKRNGKQTSLLDSNATDQPLLEVNHGWFTTTLEEDILRRYPPGSDDEDALPVYGDSGSENDCDSEEWQEILDELPHLANEEPDSALPQRAAYLSSDVVESLVSQYIDQQKEAWDKESLPKEMPYARPLWERSREGDNLSKLKEETSARLRKLDQTLSKFKKAIFDCPYRSEASVQHSCQSLDQTLAGIFLEKWRLSILEEDICPPDVDLPTRAPRSRKRRSKSVHSINSMHSEDLASTSESDTWSEHDDMADFIVEDSDVDMEQPQTESQAEMPFTLGSSSSSVVSNAAPDAASNAASNDGMDLDRSGSGSPAYERQRIAQSDEDEDMNVATDVANQTELNLELAPVFDQTGPSPPQSSTEMDGTQQTEDADHMGVGTPPVNSVSPKVAPVPDQSGASPSQSQDALDVAPQVQVQDADVMHLGIPFSTSMSPDNSQDIAVAESSPSAIQPLEPASRVPSSKASPGADSHRRGSTDSFQARPTGESDDRSLSLNLDDLDIFDTVAPLSLKTIELSKDSLDLLAKLVMGLTEDELKKYPPFLKKYFHYIHREFVQHALQAMLNNERHVEGQDQEESKLAMRMAALYVSWHHCVTLQPTDPHKHLVQESLVKLLDEEENMFDVFIEKLKELVGAARVWRRKGGPSSSAQPAADNGEGRLMVTFRLPKRKRSSGGPALSGQQKEAQDRQARQEKAREALRRQREKEGLSNHDPAGQAVTFKEPIIYLHPHIGQLVKQHQLMGIQFMWRELVEADRSQGCLLAHVMGLGKTMQVISFLATLAAARSSRDPKIREQVPEKFHRFQVLILCPSPVVENWVDEFAIWAPEDHSLGPIREVLPRRQKNERDDRLEILQSWNDEGGVLIISYDLLRTLITNQTTKTGKPLDEATHAKVQEWLLARPTIIVADEAHRLKTRESVISRITSRFSSMSRIAMTGSPLANNLSDYYQMVDWVAPDYLEDPVTFKSKFMDPIQEGSYMDSTQEQQRESLVALKLLNGILGPKVLRADTSVIAKHLPPKTEFVICVPLSDLQTRAYNMFVASLAANEDASTKLWSWLALLQLCCNHPFPFREKLADRYKQSESSEDSETGSVLPRSIQDAELPSDLLPRIEELFRSVPELRDPYLSSRSLLLAQIVQESLNAGDKVLIFSQSIPTINYLEDLLTQCGFNSYLRIDGSSSSIDRQAMTKRFNTPEGEKILLISTRAGGVGLNMFGANRVVIFDFLFNPTWEEQAVGRAYRLGQQKPVFVYRFISGGTFEDLIFNTAVFKSQLAVRVVDKKNIVRESAKQSRRYLFPVKPTEREDCDAIQGKDPQVLDKILAGKWRRCILRVSLSELRDNERDNLTEDEDKRVNEALSMERLKRSDPEEYEREQRKRQFAEIQRQRAESIRREHERAQRQLQEQQMAEERMRQFHEHQTVLQQQFQYPPNHPRRQYQWTNPQWQSQQWQPQPQQPQQWQPQQQQPLQWRPQQWQPPQQQQEQPDQQTFNERLDQWIATMRNQEEQASPSQPLPLRLISPNPTALAQPSPTTDPSAFPTPRDAQPTDGVTSDTAPAAPTSAVLGDNLIDLTSDSLDISDGETDPPASSGPPAPPNPSAPSDAPVSTEPSAPSAPPASTEPSAPSAPPASSGPSEQPAAAGPS